MLKLFSNTQQSPVYVKLSAYTHEHSNQNPLIPRLALLFEEPCPLASGWLPNQIA